MKVEKVKDEKKKKKLQGHAGQKKGGERGPSSNFFNGDLKTDPS